MARGRNFAVCTEIFVAGRRTDRRADRLAACDIVTGDRREGRATGL